MSRSLGLFLIHSKIGALFKRVNQGNDGPATNVTLGEWWYTNEADLDYHWDDSEEYWIKDEPNGNFNAITVLYPDAKGAAEGEEWYHGIRPTKLILTLNSGPDLEVNGELDCTIDVLRDGSEYIISPTVVEFDTWEQDKTVEFDFDWTGVTTQNISALRVSSNLKNNGPWIKSILLEY